MIRMCICDDREDDLKELRRLAELYGEEHPELPLQIRTFQSAYDLLDCIEESGGFDLYLLDIIMPHLSGMELAAKIRKRGEAAEILFLTISREYAVEAFSVKASGYLLKPVRKADFDDEVLSCLQKLTPEENPSISLKTKTGVRRVLIKEIVMVESFDHTRACTLADGTVVETAVTISSFYEQLCDFPCFFIPHRAYIVNLDYAKGLTASEVLIPPDKKIPVSRRRYTDLKTVYMDYMAGKTRMTPMF